MRSAIFEKGSGSGETVEVVKGKKEQGSGSRNAGAGQLGMGLTTFKRWEKRGAKGKTGGKGTQGRGGVACRLLSLSGSS